MSYKERLKHLDRDGERSISDQIVGVFTASIEAGELAPGDKLPPTRELAEAAGINHLTAVRAYRRLRELGLVSSHVGRGTFVRDSAPAALPDSDDAEGTAWQRYVLPPVAESHGDRVMAEMYRHSQARGLIPLSVGYPSSELFPFEAMQRAIGDSLERHDQRALQYTDIAGLPELREQISELSKRRGAPVATEDVVVTSGARQGLTLAARAVLRPGDVVACESPSFMGVLESIRSTGAQLAPIAVDDQGLDVDALESLLARQEIRMVALQPRCHNPTGVDLSSPRRTRLLELARRHGFFVLEDGIYGDLRLDGTEDPGPLCRDARGHVIYVDSLSKLVGGGPRVGWVVATGPVRERILVEKRLDDMHSATLPQLGLAEFLASGEYQPHLERAVQFYAERRDALVEGVEKHLRGLVDLSVPQGGGHLWLPLQLQVDESELMTEAVRNGVTFVPGAAMLPEPSSSAYMRLSFGFLSPDELREGARRLGRAIRSLSKRPSVSEALPIA